MIRRVLTVLVGWCCAVNVVGLTVAAVGDARRRHRDGCPICQITE